MHSQKDISEFRMFRMNVHTFFLMKISEQFANACKITSLLSDIKHSSKV